MFKINIPNHVDICESRSMTVRGEKYFSLIKINTASCFQGRPSPYPRKTQFGPCFIVFSRSVSPFAVRAGSALSSWNSPWNFSRPHCTRAAKFLERRSCISWLCIIDRSHPDHILANRRQVKLKALSTCSTEVALKVARNKRFQANIRRCYGQ